MPLMSFLWIVGIFLDTYICGKLPFSLWNPKLYRFIREENCSLTQMSNSNYVFIPIINVGNVCPLFSPQSCTSWRTSAAGWMVWPSWCSSGSSPSPHPGSTGRNSKHLNLWMIKIMCHRLCDTIFCVKSFRGNLKFWPSLDAGTTRSRSTTPWPRSRPSSRRSWTRPRRRSADQLPRSPRKRSRGEPKGQRGAPGRILYGFEDFNW